MKAPGDRDQYLSSEVHRRDPRVQPGMNRSVPLVRVRVAGSAEPPVEADRGACVVSGADMPKLDLGSAEGDSLNGADLSAMVVVNGVIGLAHD